MENKLFSKRHDVYLEENIIYKYYKDQHSFETEWKVLKAMGTPKILAYTKQPFLIKMAYIEGDTLLEVIEKTTDLDETIEVMTKVMDALHIFHTTFDYALRYNDLNFRNIIVSDKVYLIDFETCVVGDYRLDLIDFVAMYHMYDPVGSEFKVRVLEKLKPIVMNQTNLSASEYSLLLEASIEKIFKRRRL